MYAINLIFMIISFNLKKNYIFQVLYEFFKLKDISTTLTILTMNDLLLTI